jgi:hypothetical protein
VTWVYLAHGTALGGKEDDQPSNHAAATVAFPLDPANPVAVGCAPVEVCEACAAEVCEAPASGGEAA